MLWGTPWRQRQRLAFSSTGANTRARDDVGCLSVAGPTKCEGFSVFVRECTRPNQCRQRYSMFTPLCTSNIHLQSAQPTYTLCRQFPSNSLRGVHQTKQSRPLQDWEGRDETPRQNFRRVLEPLGNPYCVYSGKSISPSAKKTTYEIAQNG